MALLFLLSAVPSAETSRRNYLRTSSCPDAYTLFEISGNTVTAVGKYKKDRLRQITSSHNEISSMKFTGHEDGSFEAKFTMDSINGESNIILNLESGAKIAYRVFCDGGGWYFHDNGLSKKNRLVFDNILHIPPEATPFYYTAHGESEASTEIQLQVKRISDSVTEGIEDDYEKARALCAYVASHIYYDHDAKVTSVSETTVALENVIADSRTVCIGFASYYCALLQAQGIDAVTVVGAATSTDISYENLPEGQKNHQFSAFWYEKEQRWVWTDPCWNGSGDYRNGEYVPGRQHEKFFDITDDALAQYHRADYAIHVDYMADMRDPSETTASEETTEPEETTAPEETTTPARTTAPETTAATSSEASAAAAPEEIPVQKRDNTPLIIAAAVLAAGIVGLIIFIIVTVKKNR